MHKRSDRLAVHNLLQIAHNVHVEYVDGEVVLLAHCCGCEIHHFQSASINLVVCDVAELGCGWVFLWVGCVDAVNACTLEHNVGFNLNAAQT